MSVGGSSCFTRVVVVVALTVALLLGVALCAPPSPTASKRSAEDIQFGNQQNPPVSLLDDSALPGAFPSSENSDENTIGKGGGGREQQLQQEEEQLHQQQEQQLQSENDDPRQQEDSQEDVDEDEEGSLVAPVAEPNTWRVPAPHNLHLYQLGWRTPVVYGAAAYPGRRRRSVYAAIHPDPRKVPQVPLKVLRAGQRHKRDLRRYRRDLATGADLEKLLEDVDVVELLAMLAGAPHRRPGGYGTVSYAPAPPRYAPQPKLFPDYEDAEEEDEEAGEERGLGPLQQQDVRAAHLPEAVMVPAGGRVWRRSGGYGLSSMPGFKRTASSFRANRPRLPSPSQGFSQADLHSLAVMLGAELDPVTHRLRRTAM